MANGEHDAEQRNDARQTTEGVHGIRAFAVLQHASEEKESAGRYAVIHR